MEKVKYSCSNLINNGGKKCPTIFNLIKKELKENNIKYDKIEKKENNFIGYQLIYSILIDDELYDIIITANSKEDIQIQRKLGIIDAKIHKRIIQLKKIYDL